MERKNRINREKNDVIIERKMVKKWWKNGDKFDRLKSFNPSSNRHFLSIDQAERKPPNGEWDILRSFPPPPPLPSPLPSPHLLSSGPSWSDRIDTRWEGMEMGRGWEGEGIWSFSSLQSFPWWQKKRRDMAHSSLQCLSSIFSTKPSKAVNAFYQLVC